MTDEAQLQEWKQEWRRLVPDSIAKALEAMEEKIPPFSPKYKLLVNLRARVNDANRGRIAGTLSNEDLQLEYNRIRMSLLETIDALSVEDFRQPMGQSPDERKRGYLLHKIPPQMQVGKEEECIIRLAYEQAAIVQDIELSEEVEVKQVTVSKIMQAELIDPNAEPAFAIRTYSDEEQFLQEGEYTEWKFWVEPLREGTFALLLKISVVEVIEGRERTRNLTWEEKVQIVTEAPQIEPAFRESGIAFAYQPEGHSESIPQPPAGVQPSPQAGAGRGISLDDVKKMYDIQTPWEEAARSPQPSAPAPARRRVLNIRRLSVAATVLIAVGVALFQLQLFTGERNSPSDVTNPGPVDVEKGEPPDTTDTLAVPDAPAKAGQAEEAQWEQARRTGERRYYEQYLERYPEGRYAEEARKWLEGK
ncbi:MAG: hypothetical protein J5I98_17945 [Phaeodactylibacter sp.]|nr:hypothetical protein [Phaeodactylibacter sp.]